MDRKTLLSCLLFCVLAGSFDSAAFAAAQYTIKPGDTMWKISHAYSIELENLIKANPQISNPDLIYPGQKINVPEQMKMSFSEEEKLLALTNHERQKSGLKPLIIDTQLNQAAIMKSKDMREHQYVAHNSPTYGNTTLMLRNLRITFREVKENIGAGQMSAEEVFDTWMNSSVNRNHLLEKNATHAGIGYVQGGLHGHYWTILIIEKN